MRQTFAARRRDIRDRMSFTLTYANRAEFHFTVNQDSFRILLDMAKPPLEILPYSSERFVPFRLKQHTLVISEDAKVDPCRKAGVNREPRRRQFSEEAIEDWTERQ